MQPNNLLDERNVKNVGFPNKIIQTLFTEKKFKILFYCICCLLGLILAHIPAFAKEGMWIPASLASREKDMRLEGLEIPVGKLYNDSGTGLNNAIILFGRGCTGEVVSPNGLILTNHHCGYGSVQRLSGSGKDYFSDGFWADSLTRELPCTGLTVTFIKEMYEVTDSVLNGIDDTLNDTQRDTIAIQRIRRIEDKYKAKTGLEATVKPFYQGNQYWVILSKTYNDVRLVGFPPNGIGKFGGDDENWVWPRHTGDFSMFRIYANDSNQPAGYSDKNKPMHTDNFFKINTSGYKDGDFTMVYGFPGTTDEYAYSARLNQVYSILDPLAIEARTAKLNTWNRHMDANRNIFLQYTAKNAGIANGWKKWQGEVLGLKINHVVEKKMKFETNFRHWAQHDTTLPYAANLLDKIDSLTRKTDSTIYLDQLTKETVMSIELIQQASVLDKMLACTRMKLSENEFRDTINALTIPGLGLYKNFDAATDLDVFKTLFNMYQIKAGKRVPGKIADLMISHSNDIDALAYDVYHNSVLNDEIAFKRFASKLKSSDSLLIQKDLAWQIYHAISLKNANEITPIMADYNKKMRYLNRLYMKARMIQEPDRAFYPDANLTLRLTYGKIAGLKLWAKPYCYKTTLKDVVAIDDSLKPDFRVPQKLKDLYYKKDYGRWSLNSEMPVAFVATNHTSGGNSGSPVLNARGNLIGINFDRAYEGTMSDYYFDPTRCRNIAVDIRYVLFIIDKFGNCGRLIDEMNLVKD